MLCHKPDHVYIKELGWCTPCPIGKFANKGEATCKAMSEAMKKQAARLKAKRQAIAKESKTNKMTCPKNKYLVASLNFCNFCPRGKFAGKGWNFCCLMKKGEKRKKCASPYSHKHK